MTFKLNEGETGTVNITYADKTNKCRLCCDSRWVEVIDLGNQPIAHWMAASPGEEENRYPLSLHYCSSCGLIQVVDPIPPEILYSDYNYCFSSWKPQPHVRDEGETLLACAGKGPVIEIGCNDGLFLDYLKKIGFPRLAGIEANPHAAQVAVKKGFTVYNEFLSVSLCRGIVEKNGKFKAVAARQILEHLSDLNEFFQCIDILLSENGILFIDLPNIETGLKMGDISFIWEEHTNYFTTDVLLATLHRFGFREEIVKNYDFSGGSLAVFARRKESATKMLEENIDRDGLAADVKAFEGKVREYEDRLKKVLGDCRKNGFSIVLYGVGCRACTVVNGLALRSFIDFAVDDQQERQEKYMPGSRLKVVAPAALKKNSAPLLCLLAVNRENEDKVKAKLKELRSSHAKTVAFSLFSPNDIFTELETVALP